MQILDSPSKIQKNFCFSEFTLGSPVMTLAYSDILNRPNEFRDFPEYFVLEVMQ